MNRREFLKNGSAALIASVAAIVIATPKSRRNPTPGSKFFLTSRSPHPSCDNCGAKILLDQVAMTYNGKADGYDSFTYDAPFFCEGCGRILTEYYDDDCNFQYATH